MPGKYLLDTNTAIKLLADELNLERRLAGDAEVYVSIVALGELLYGAERSQRVGENTARIERFASRFQVLPCDLQTARTYGKIKKELRAKGRPIPENDIWIAATARQHGLTLVTGDGHFAEVEGLPREAW